MTMIFSATIHGSTTLGMTPGIMTHTTAHGIVIGTMAATTEVTTALYGAGTTVGATMATTDGADAGDGIPIAVITGAALTVGATTGDMQDGVHLATAAIILDGQDALADA